MAARKNASSVPTVTARAGPRFLLSALLFLTILMITAVLLAVFLANLPDRSSFWSSGEGIAVAEVALALVLAFTLLPALLLWLSEGRITADEGGLRWNIRGRRGEIRWDRPFTLRRWQSIMVVRAWGESGVISESPIPVIVYEVTQGDTSLTFYRSATRDEVQVLPSGELRGVMLHQHARKLTKVLEQKANR